MKKGIKIFICFFFSSRRRHTRYIGDWFRRVLFRSHQNVYDLVPVTLYGRKILRHPTVQGERLLRDERFVECRDLVDNFSKREPRRRHGQGLALEIGRASCRESGEWREGAGSVGE